MAKPKTKGLKQPSREIAELGIRKLRASLAQFEYAGRKAEFCGWLIPQLDELIAGMKKDVESAVRDMTPAYLKKRPELLAEIQRVVVVEHPFENTQTVDSAETKTFEFKAPEIPEGAVVAAMPVDAVPEPVEKVVAPAVDPVAASPGWPGECELYVESAALNRRLMVARLYEVGGGQKYRRVSLFKDARGLIRPGLKIKAKLKIGGGSPIYEMVVPEKAAV